MEELLRRAGLAERLELFQQQRIDASQLPELSDDDLRELGLTIGERRRFRRSFPEPSGLPRAPPANGIAGERRPLTMQFVDLVNSTALAERLDPEDLLELIRLYRECCGAEIVGMGGHVARFLGDGILAYFCYPVATENDPERAVRAALAIVGRLGELSVPQGERLAARVGIATGNVIVGDLWTGATADIDSVIGSAPNLAARLQRFARPNGVVVSDVTFERIRSLFDCEEVAAEILGSDGAAIRAWHVLRERARKSRSRNFGRAQPRMRGRDDEQALVARAWTSAQSGAGRVVVLAGEAGIGKSTVVERFLADTPEASRATVLLVGSEVDQDTPYYPIMAHMRALATGDEGRVPSRAALEAVLAGSPALRAEALALLGGLLGLADLPPPDATLSAPRRRERVKAAIRGQLVELTRAGAACVVVEDLHWIDPSTLELLGEVVADAASLRLLILVTTRPEPAVQWPAAAHVEHVALRRLQPSDMRLMVQDLVGALAVPAALLHRIMERGDGVPLFVQEIVRSVLAATDAAAGDGVPASLQDSLMARLDRLGTAKQVAQTAALIGRTVSRRVLAEVADLRESELAVCLARLEESGVLRRDGEDAFAFTHALVRDIAYDSLLRDRRRAMHRRTARALEMLEPRFAADQPAAMALHLTEAGEVVAAAKLWLEAARRSLEASALTEATRLLRRGLDALETAPASPEVAALRIAMVGLLGPALMSLRGPGAAETQALYDRSYALCQTLPEQPSHFPIYWGWWRVSKDIHTMRVRSGWVLDRARAQGDPEFLLQAHHCCWASHYNMGDFATCHTHLREGLRCYGETDWRHLAPLYGNHDARACAHGELALLHWMQGRPATADVEKARSLGWADGLGHLGSRIHAMDIALTFAVMRRRHREVFDRAEELTGFTTEHGLTDHAAKGRIYRGWTMALNGDAPGGLKLLRDGFAMQHDIGTSEDFPIYVSLLADALMAAGEPDRAVEELIRAQASFDAMGLRIWLPEVLRTTAEAMLAADPASRERAEALLVEADMVAKRQDVPMLGLRIATARARLHASQGEHREAAERLRQAVADISEPSRNEDVAAAETFLAGLHARIGPA